MNSNNSLLCRPISARVTGLVFAALMLGGCANQLAVWRNDDGAGRVLAMDAQQRVVLSSKVDAKRTGSNSGQRTLYCPEPSPDAIASYASALGASLVKGDATASAQANLASAVAATGIRTPTTQIIRDLMTAACVAHMNGALTGEAFESAYARNQQFVLAAHAIAVIGGEPTVVGATTAGTSSFAGSEAIGKLAESVIAQVTLRQKLVEEHEAKKSAAAAAAAKVNGDKAAREAAKAKTPPDPTAVTAAEDALAKSEAEKLKQDAAAAKAKAAAEDAAVLEAATKSALDAAVAARDSKASGTANPASVSRPATTLSDQAIKSIEGITSGVIASAFTLDKCLKAAALLKEKAVETQGVKDAVENLCRAAIDLEGMAAAAAATRLLGRAAPARTHSQLPASRPTQ